MVLANVDGPGIERVKAALEAGAVVGLPTDTVYGLGVAPAHPGAVDRLFELKGRPETIAVAVLVADLDQAAVLTPMTESFEALAKAFWPGALTIVAPRARGVDYELGGDEASIGIRCPDAPFVRALCRRVGPLAVTSANRHGDPPATSAAQLRSIFGPQLLIADGGPCLGAPSTVVDVRVDPPRCLRSGAVGFEQVRACLKTSAGSELT